MEMKGASISLFKLDNELKKLLDAPSHSPFLLQQLQQA
jgi:dihydroxyacetone kinase